MNGHSVRERSPHKIIKKTAAALALILALTAFSVPGAGRAQPALWRAALAGVPEAPAEQTPAGWPVTLPAAEDPSFLTEGSWQFTATDTGAPAQDRFLLREDCFFRSSFEGCTHLAELSMQAALASSEKIGEGSERYAQGGGNITALLSAMGFEDVETNAYYQTEPLADSAAAAAGHRTLRAFGRTFTLLAVIPRSGGYENEWIGNLTVGSGGLHEGFLAGRDEILRFVKQYVQRHGISGDIKIWTAGHSRGAALANLVAAFFADGGAGYLGAGVRIAPEDVYAYTFATPRTVRTTAADRELRSVAGARGGVYAADTPGAAYTAGSERSVDPQAAVYGGIRNFLLPYDLIPEVPPASWGYTWFGRVFSAEGSRTPEEMLQALGGISPTIRAQAEGSGDVREFLPQTWDLSALKKVPAEGETGAAGYTAFLARLLAGLTGNVRSAEIYANGRVQETLQALAVFAGRLREGLIVPQAPEEGAATPDPAAGTGQKPAAQSAENPEPFGEAGLPAEALRPLAFTYLAYAAERLKAEHRASSDGEAAAIVIEELLGLLTGEPIDETSFTVDDFLVLAARVLTGEEGSPAAAYLADALTGLIPEEGGAVLTFLLEQFRRPDEEDGTFRDLLLTLLKACAEGPQPGTTAAFLLRDAAGVRKALYLALPLVFARQVPNMAQLLGHDRWGAEDGSAPFSGLVSAFLPGFLTEKDAEGTILHEYASLAEAADAGLAVLLAVWLTEETAEPGTPPGSSASSGVPDGPGAGEREALLTLRENVRTLRELITYGLFYESGKRFSTASDLQSLATLTDCAPIAACAHYGEVYLAWARAEDRAAETRHRVLYAPEIPPTLTEEGRTACYIWVDGGTVRYFADRELSREIRPEEAVLATLPAPADPREETPTVSASAAETAPQPESPGSPLWWVIGAAGMAAVLSAVLFLLGKKKEEEEDPPGDREETGPGE